MSKIVKREEFKKVVDALWDNVKNNFVTITKSLEFVSKIKPNVISEKTTIVDGYVLGSKVSSVDNKPNTPSYMSAGGFFIYELLQIPNGTKVSHITIGVNDSLNVGDTVSGVVVGFAKHKTTIDHINKTYEIVEYLVQDGKGVVHKNTDTDLTCDKAVSIAVDKEMTDDLVLIVGCENAIWGEKTGSVLNGLAYGGGTAPIVGSEVPLGYGNWVGKVSIYADGVSLNDLSKNVTTNSSEIQNIKNNKVDRTEVGNLANQIPQIDGTGKLVASIMPDLAITSVQVVTNEAEMMRLTNIQVGDVVVVENEGNKTYMCKDPSQTNKDQKFIAINMGTPMVMKVNNQSPSATGEVTLDGSHIDGSFKGYPAKKLDVHLDEFDTRIIQNLNKILSLELQDNNHTRLINDLTNVNNVQNNRIQALENRPKTQHRVGDIIQTFGN